MKRLSQRLSAITSAYATAHPVRSAVLIGLGAGAAATVVYVASGGSLGGALLFGCALGACAFAGARLGEWLINHGFGDDPGADPGQTEHLSELTYAATSHPDHPQMPDN
jgi:hypothetical protein